MRACHRDGIWHNSRGAECRVGAEERGGVQNRNDQSMSEPQNAPRPVPDDVKTQATEIVRRFSEQYSLRGDCYYSVRFRGKHAFVDRSDNGRIRPICRLTYTGEMDGWEFVLYKWSSGRYDRRVTEFPGAELLDGTVEGAMRAGLEAYPR